MRIGIIALLQESNTFAPARTTIEDFEADLLLTDDDVRARLADAPHEVGGFFAGLAQVGVNAVPIFAARAIPWGPLTASTYEALFDRMFGALHRAGTLDGVLVAPHGATVSESILDVDGHWLTELRKHVGQAVPIIGTLDLHANLSPAMVEATDALIAYRTNPHLDQRARGIEAALLMSRALRGDVQPTQAAAFLPMSVNIECQHTEQPPCLDVFRRLNALSNEPRVLTASVLLGFPYADVPEMGASTLVVTNNSLTEAVAKADELAGQIWQNRSQFVEQPMVPADAIARAKRLDGPVCLLDVGDNIGGGGPADSTYLAQALLKANVGPSLICLNDPETAITAEQSGVGSVIHAKVGGKQFEGSGQAIESNFRVRGIFSGKFSEPRPRHGGFLEFDQGRTAVLETIDRLMTIVVTSRRTPPYSLAQLTSCNLDPSKFQVVVAKGVHAPVAAYREVCREFIRVNTDGVTTANTSRLAYSHRRRPLYPFEMNASWNPRDANNAGSAAHGAMQNIQRGESEASS